MGRSSQQTLLGFTRTAPEQVYYNDLFLRFIEGYRGIITRCILAQRSVLIPKDYLTIRL